MSQFDKTTREKAVSYGHTHADTRPAECGFVAGRNSAKQSLEILSKAAMEVCKLPYTHADRMDEIMREAIDQVKELGDWPLGE